MGAVDTPMRTSAIRIDRLRESDVGGVVARDDALRVLDRDHRLRFRRLVAGILEPAVVGFLALPHLEATFDVDGRATAFHGLAMVSGGGFERHDESLREQRPRMNRL